MDTILGLLALIAIAFLGLRYLLLPGSYTLKSVVGSVGHFKVSALHKTILLLLLVAVVQAGQFSAQLLLVWIGIFVAWLLKGGLSIKRSRIFLVYGLFLVWLLISLFLLSPVPDFGLRVILKYSYPFLLLLVVARMPNNSQFFFKALKLVFYVGLSVNIILLLPKLFPILSSVYGPINALLWYGPAIIDTNPLFLVVSLLLFAIQRKRLYLLTALIILSLPILTAIRTGLIGLFFTLLALSYFKYKLKALPYIGALALTSLLAIVFVPQVRDKMFVANVSSDKVLNSYDQMTTDDIDSNGRFAMWEWSLNRFYKGNEWTGSGVGSLQARFYSGNHPFGEIKIVHNDYVQLLCDTGLPGLGLYLTIIIVIVLQCYKLYNTKVYDVSLRYSALIAGTSLVGIMACAFTDNVINYSLVTLSYPYVFFGFALALKRNQQKQSS